MGPNLAAVVPATDRPATLDRCVSALRAALRDGDELIVVTVPEALGPAAARNLGAARTRAEVIVFVDSDVVVHANALDRLRAAFAADAGLAAVFGSYDDRPPARGAVSQFRNLLHHHVHQRHAGAAATFWSGLGAVRRADFLAVGGFDPARFTHPAVEDIDLGMRLRARGARIRLDPAVQGTHLKHWTLRGMVHTDFRRRGLPWTLLCLEHGGLPPTLNLCLAERASAGGLLVATSAALTGRGRLAAGVLAATLALDAPFLRLLHRRTGARGTAAGVALHAVHRLVGAASLAGGVALHASGRGTPSTAAGAPPPTQMLAAPRPGGPAVAQAETDLAAA